MSAFQEMKDRLAECATTAYFEVGKDIEVVLDASLVGLAALLVQERSSHVIRKKIPVKCGNLIQPD